MTLIQGRRYFVQRGRAFKASINSSSYKSDQDGLDYEDLLALNKLKSFEALAEPTELS